jgi:2Fe-2S ferredoxin
MDKRKAIFLNIEHEGIVEQVETFPNEYRSLMMLIFDRICPEDFGECAGMGKCGSCTVLIVEDPTAVDDYRRNEAATLKRAGITEKGVRLSCQLLVNENINGCTFKII